MIQRGDIVIGLALATIEYVITKEGTEWVVLDSFPEEEIIYVAELPMAQDYPRIQKDYDEIVAQHGSQYASDIAAELGGDVFDVSMRCFKAIGSFKELKPENNEEGLALLNKDP